MIINVRAEGFKLKSGVKEGLNAKLLPIDELFPDGTIYDVFVKRTENEDYKCEIKVQNGRDFIRSEASGDRIEYSINNAIKTLKKRVHKIKGMKIDKKRRHFLDDVTLDTVETAADDKSDILRTKHLEASVMTENEAILSLESLDHDFYAFRNANKDDSLCVLYRRGKGYGLLVIE